VELVNNWLLGEAEQTIGMKYASTADGRNAAVHERSQLAGSGDPKKAAAVKTSPEKLPTAPLPGTLARDTGDKDEVHTSEEELGVTTPRKKGRVS
jgi:hypothetical protein